MCVYFLCVEGNSHINMSPARWSNKIMAIREIKEEEGKNGWLVGRMVLGKHYHPPTTIPETSYPPPSFEMAAAVAARVSQKTSTVYPTRVLTTRTYTRQRFPPPSQSSHQKWEGNTLGNLDRREFLFISFLEWLDSLSLSSDLEIDDV